MSEYKQAHIAFQATLYESKNPTRRWLHNRRRDWVRETVKCYAPFKPRFFEIGVGCAVYTTELAKTGTVFGIDINADFIAAAKTIPNVAAEVADITRKAIRADFDLALCSEVLEHIPDSQSALNNIFASLKPGGYLVLTTPNSYSTVELVARLLAFGPVIKLARWIYGESVDDLGHVNRMTAAQLRAQIDRAGFEVVVHDNIVFYLPVIAEFMGKTGLRICQWFEEKLRGSRFQSLLWTQCWVLRRPL